jgi:hypothetical protein
MRTSTLALSLLLGASAALSFSLWRQLEAQRQLPGSPPEAAAAMEDRDGRTKAPDSIPGTEGSGHPAMDHTDGAGDPPARPEIIAIAGQLADRLPLLQLGIPPERELLKDAEYRMAQLTKLRLTEEAIHPGLSEFLGLSKEEAEGLFAAMAESQLAMVESIPTNNGKASIKDLSDALARQSTAQDEALRRILGDARHARLASYRLEVQPAMMEFARLERALASAGQPLSDAQSRAMKESLIGELQRHRQQVTDLQSGSSQQDPATLLARANERTEEMNRRVLSTVTPYLDATQIRILQARNEEQSAAGDAAATRLMTGN